MNLVEAYECGKMVRHPASHGRTAIQAGRSLRWLDDKGMADTYVTVDNGLLHGWELVPDPPKRYTFKEALAMMCNGKWMRFVGSNIYHRRMPDGKWHHLDVNGTDVPFHWENLPVKSFDMMWEERQ